MTKKKMMLVKDIESTTQKVLSVLQEDIGSHLMEYEISTQEEDEFVKAYVNQVCYEIRKRVKGN